MQRLIAGAVVVATLAAAVFAADIAQARGRGRPSPYVMTPNGPVLKSVYYAQNMQIVNPEMLAIMQQQEQAMLNKGKKGTNTSGAKGTKTTGTTAGKPAVANKK